MERIAKKNFFSQVLSTYQQGDQQWKIYEKDVNLQNGVEDREPAVALIKSSWLFRIKKSFLFVGRKMKIGIQW